ncbi:glycosyltransferase family 2 protein [Chloroflexi bacterium TSY]|nr:glycosyltransferase family 2 protein [Chloroflexi bacterium TSY]MBV7330774.1 glycosyltransferase family 2 protein [Chloroflexi bacterium TSY]
MNTKIDASPRCSVIIVGYNSASDLPTCLQHLIAQAYPDFEIILVDNASIDETEIIAKEYQCSIRYLRLNKNIGFAAGNNAGAAIANGDILVFLNPDTQPQPGWLAELVRPLCQEPNIGMTTSRVLLADRPNLINACGNDITWTGITVCRGLEDVATNWETSSDVAAVSGASFAIPRVLFKELGGFDTSFFLYFEDTDLSLRTQLMGYRLLYVSSSIVTHRYRFKFSPQKAYYQERNRWLALFKTLRVPTLLILLPGLLLGEVMAWVYAATQGPAHLKAKFRSWSWLWHHRQKIQAQRRKTNAQRRVHDRAILRHWSPHLRFAGTMPDLPAQILEHTTAILLKGYGRLCQRLAIW